MKKKITWMLRTALLLALCLCLLIPSGHAAGGDPLAQVGYTAKAILPDNQLSGSGYFNLLMKPGARQVVEVEVSNHQSIPLVISVEINGASTNQNGLIEYTAQEREAQTPLPHGGIPDLAVAMLDGLHAEGNRITVSAGETIRIPIAISMPESAIEGQLLGGIVLTKQEDVANQTSASFSIRSLYSYAIALQLQTTKEPGMPPAFALQSAAPGSIAGWDALVVSVRNMKPLVIASAQMRVRVTAQDTQEVILDLDGQRVSIAPETILPFTAALPEGAHLAPGAYTVTVDLTYNGSTTSMQTEMVLPQEAA